MKKENVNLLESKLFTEHRKDGTENLFLSLRYSIEREHEVRELIIPKIDLGINSGSHPVVDIDRVLNSATVTSLAGFKYRLLPGYITGIDKNGKSFDDYDYCRLFVKEEKPREMTLEEIEKKLGFKVKIVSKEGDK